MNSKHRQEVQYSLFSQSHGVLELPVDQQPSLIAMMHDSVLQRKWVYILAEQLTLSDCPQYCIAIKKPSVEVELLWIEKIISAGQAALIVVENMQFDEITNKRLTLLCLEQGVTIVNIPPVSNLVYGPW
ncbi:hypothetical protein QX776_13255 [Alteromonadaceae bacterium BrNp21-10]|nr:hypothetical protein [Alteromonadaceae bacterium BrNp21-10]